MGRAQMPNRFILTLHLNERVRLLGAAKVAAVRRGISLQNYVLEALKVLLTHDSGNDKVIYYALYEKGYTPTQIAYRRRRNKKIKALERKLQSHRRGLLDPTDKHPLRPQKLVGL